MQTFKISKVQEQSYYAIRIFGIVHLLAAVGVVVLLDGPGDVLLWISWLLILCLLFSSAFLTLRIFQARAGRLHGHYVLTRNTLAILMPGQPRVFVRRAACTAFLPGRWELVLRKGCHQPLRTVSSRPYLQDLVSGVCQVWWPGLYGTLLWKGFLEKDPGGSLDLRVDLRGSPEGHEPLLVYTVGRSHYVRHYGGIAGCGLLLLGIVWLIRLTWVEAIGGDTPGTSHARYAIAGTACVLGAAGTLAALAYTTRQVFFYGSLLHAFVISDRSLAVLRAGKKTEFYRSGSLQYYNKPTGRLFFSDGSETLVAPYLYGCPYNGLLRILFTRWRPGRAYLPLHDFGISSVLGVLLMWLFACSIFGSFADVEWGATGGRYVDAVWNTVTGMIYFVGFFLVRKDFVREFVARTDVSTGALANATAAGGERETIKPKEGRTPRS